jgi:hypothetical protein
MGIGHHNRLFRVEFQGLPDVIAQRVRVFSFPLEQTVSVFELRTAGKGRHENEDHRSLSFRLHGGTLTVQLFQHPDEQDECRFLERVFKHPELPAGIVLKHLHQALPVFLVMKLERPCSPLPAIGQFFQIGSGDHTSGWIAMDIRDEPCMG